MTLQQPGRRTIDENTLFIEQWIGEYSGIPGNTIYPLPVKKYLQDNLDHTENLSCIKTTAIFLIFPKK